MSIPLNSPVTAVVKERLQTSAKGASTNTMTPRKLGSRKYRQAIFLFLLCFLIFLFSQIREAARVDGAGEFTCFVRIIMPNLKPVLYTITVLSFLNTFKAFREAYLVAG